MACFDAFVDGACSGNPGRGAWAVVVARGATPDGAQEVTERHGTCASTTNNRMELQAAIEALKLFSECGAAGQRLRITTDSRYVCSGACDWLPRWKAHNWRTAGGRPVKNLEQWGELDTLMTPVQPEWRWVRGHAGEWPLHERADQLARAAARGL